MTLESAVESVKGYARKHRDVIQVAEALEEIGSLKNAQVELRLLHEKACEKLKSVQIEIGAAQERRDIAIGQVKESEASVKNVVATARNTAGKLVAVAKDEAAKMKQAAQKEVDKIRSDAMTEKVAWDKNKKQWLAIEKDLKLRIDELRAEMAALKGRLDV